MKTRVVTRHGCADSYPCIPKNCTVNSLYHQSLMKPVLLLGKFQLGAYACRSSSETNAPHINGLLQGLYRQATRQCHTMLVDDIEAVFASPKALLF